MMRTVLFPAALPSATAAILAAALGWTGLCQSALGAPEASTKERPNILYIFTDDQSRRSIGAYPEAHPWVKTPNIDRLAENGLRFTHCYTGAWCQPSRTCMLTGKLQHAHNTVRITNYPMASYDPKALPFWPSVFRKNGYSTDRYTVPDCIEELYNLEDDPEELDNLAVRKKHHQRLLQFRKETEREFLEREGDFVKHLPRPSSPGSRRKSAW
jgi:hypothetical protein